MRENGGQVELQPTRGCQKTEARGATEDAPEVTAGTLGSALEVDGIRL